MNDTNRHGLHRPDRCCVHCHVKAVADDPVARLMAMSPAPISRKAAEAVEDDWEIGHNPPDRGTLRTLAARMQTSEMAGDQW